MPAFIHENIIFEKFYSGFKNKNLSTKTMLLKGHEGYIAIT